MIKSFLKKESIDFYLKYYIIFVLRTEQCTTSFILDFPKDSSKGTQGVTEISAIWVKKQKKKTHVSRRKVFMNTFHRWFWYFSLTQSVRWIRILQIVHSLDWKGPKYRLVRKTLCLASQEVVFLLKNHNCKFENKNRSQSRAKLRILLQVDYSVV